MSSIKASFKHEFNTEFIIDENKDFSKFKNIDFSEYDRFFIIIDKTVNEIYGSLLLEEFNKYNKKIYILTVESIEKTKSTAFYPEFMNFLECNRATRYDAVFAIGGGVVIDLVSFGVSTYMRGLPFFIIATTLIGQTDASTAGKTCLNTANTKNLLGTFYYPLVVYNNINFLKTNPKRILRQGLSECFKYGLLNSTELIKKIQIYIEKPCDSTLTEIIKLTIHSRIAIRQKDPLASNLGHTFGHALEKYFNYGILHGDAISIGTVFALHYAVFKNLISSAKVFEIIEIMKKSGLNIYIDENLNTKKLIDFMKTDKKSSANDFNLILIEDIEKPYKDTNNAPFYKTSPEDVEMFLNKFLKKYKYKIPDYSVFLEKEEIKYDN